MDTTARVDHSMNNAACECLCLSLCLYSIYICQLFPLVYVTFLDRIIVLVLATFSLVLVLMRHRF
jgi:hypothetical protein